jgi:hypothetical protein
MALGVAMGANAQQSEKPQETQAITVATVNIYNAALTNQATNGELTIAFELNNREGIQSNIKYAVNLIQQTKDKSILMDQQVYDEEVTLGQNETKQKKITYTPPYFLGGTYQLMIEARNNDGLTLGLADAGNVLLSGNGQNVIIYQDSCYLTIEEDKENKHYTLSQGADIKPEENISLNCEIENKVAGDIIVTPTFTTYYRSTFGKKLAQKTTEPISLKQGEKSLKSFAVPTQTEPQAYDTVFTLNDDSSNPISEKITAHYVIAGQSASIQNVQFDKNSYRQGETAKLSFFYSGNASNFPNARNNQQEETLNVEINIQDQDNKACAPIFKKELAQESFSAFDIVMTQNCTNPIAQVTIKDKDGKVLAQNSFGTSEKTTKPKTPIAESTNDWGTGAKAALLGAAVLAFIILIAIFTKKRKGKALIWLLAFVLVGLAMGEGAKADTFMTYYDFYYTDDSGGGHVEYTSAIWSVSLNKRTFSPSETVTASSNVSSQMQGYHTATCYNGGDSDYYYDNLSGKLSGTINGSKKTLGTVTSYIDSYSQKSAKTNFPEASWSVESAPGNYKASIEATTSDDSQSISIPYTVTAPVVVNGSCGSANGGSYASAPSSGLCSAGTASAVTGSWSWTCTGSGTGHTNASCSATKPAAVCTVSSWSPATSTVCSGNTFEQTSNCGGKRNATGTKSCPTGCTVSSWSPDPSTVCNTDTVNQTSNCLTTRSVMGTKSCPTGCTVSSWSPDPSTFCSTDTVNQTSNCLTTRSVMGTKSCCTPATSFSCSYDPPLNDQICDGESGLINVNPSCSCTSLCGGSCPTSVTLGHCNSAGKNCSPKVINCTNTGNRDIPGGYEEVAP